MDKQNGFEMTDTRYSMGPPYPGDPSGQYPNQYPTQYPQQYPQNNLPPYTPGPIVQVQEPIRTTVITTSPTIVLVNNLGPNPSSCFCNACNTQVVTVVDKGTSTKTHLIAAVLCLLGCWCCVCIPYCTDSCKKSFHYCPQCNAFMGSSN